MNDFVLLDYWFLLDAFFNQNLFRDEILYQLNFFPIFISDFSCYEIY